MPAIDPRRLQREVETLLDDFGTPDRLVRRTLDLLDFYADRARRPGSAIKAADARKAFGVARPVLRSLERGLSRQAAIHPAFAQQVAEALWQAGYRETYLLAGSVLGILAAEQVADIIARWAEDCRELSAMEALTGPGMANWRRHDPRRFLRQIETWLSRPQSRKQTELALLALADSARDPSFDDLPSIYRLIEGKAGPIQGTTLQAMQSLILALAGRNPAEACQFLLNALPSGDTGSRRLVRRCLAAFPERQRDQLRRALSAPIQAGIIRKR